jgi:hypothetical protein
LHWAIRHLAKNHNRRNQHGCRDECDGQHFQIRQHYKTPNKRPYFARNQRQKASSSPFLRSQSMHASHVPVNVVL